MYQSTRHTVVASE